MIKIAFIDFQDSFSFNVVQKLMEVGFEVSVFTYPDHQKAWDEEYVLLGPGPGHPREYKSILPFLSSRLKSDKKTFGVCLGHQLIWSALGYEVERSKLPLHGQKVKMELDQDWMNFLNLKKTIEVQRYNSLVVQLEKGESPPGVSVFFSQNELQMSRSKNWVSYQFHPESVGTSFQNSFFSVLKTL